MYRKYFKRPLDFLGALFLLIILSPLLLVVTVWLHFANKGAGAFFVQERPGKNARIFKVIKFKSATDERGRMGTCCRMLKDLQKLVDFASTSIDELPQLINVPKAKCRLSALVTFNKISSIVPKEQSRGTMSSRHNGWAQVNGRNAISWQQKFEYIPGMWSHFCNTDLEIF